MTVLEISQKIFNENLASWFPSYKMDEVTDKITYWHMNREEEKPVHKHRPIVDFSQVVRDPGNYICSNPEAGNANVATEEAQIIMLFEHISLPITITLDWRQIYFSHCNIIVCIRHRLFHEYTDLIVLEVANARKAYRDHLQFLRDHEHSLAVGERDI